MLIERLKLSKVGCHVGNIFVGALGYADDICLLAPSRTAINNMLQICEKYGLDFKVEFNSSKSHVTICTKNVTPLLYAPLVMNGRNISKKQSVIHLDIPIGNTQCNRSIINKVLCIIEI